MPLGSTAGSPGTMGGGGRVTARTKPGKRPRATGLARTPVWRDGGPYQRAGLATHWGPWAGAASPSHTRPPFSPTTDNGRQPWPGTQVPRGRPPGGRIRAAQGLPVPDMQSPFFSCYKWQSRLSAPTCGAEARLVHLKDHSSPPQFINQASCSPSAARRSEPTSP